MRNEEKSWILADSKAKQYGPYTSFELEKKYRRGEINGNTLCWPHLSSGLLAGWLEGWKPLNHHFPSFKGTVECPLQSPKTMEPCTSGEDPVESVARVDPVKSDTIWIGTTDGHTPLNNSQDELARLLRVVIANQERQITSLKGIHWGIAAFAVLLLSRLFL